MTYQARVSTSENTGTGPGATNAPMAVCRLTTSASNGARHVAEVEVQLRLAARRERRVALGAQRLEVTDVLLGLVHLPPRLVEPGRGREPRRPGLVDLVRRHELPAAQFQSNFYR